MSRVISGVVLAGAALAAIWFLPVSALRWVACLVAVLAAHEYVGIGAARGASRVVVPGLVFAACWLMSSGQRVDPVVPLVVLLAWVAIEVLLLGSTLHQAAVGLVAPLYIGIPLGMLVAIQGRLGASATLLLIGTVLVSDSAQYYSGRAFGKRPLAPAISPKKTVEGAVGGVVLGAAAMAAAGPWLLPDLAAPWIAIGLTVVLLGICGDLFESRLKRTAGVKDSSRLIPGHGGVLDRIDALLFAIPPYYLFIVAAA